MATCIEYHEERTQECDNWEDQGFDSCSAWSPWFAWICIATTWVVHWVCVGWVWVTTSVCVAWDAAVTVVDALLVTLEGIVGWIFNVAAAIIELIFLIPFIGPLLNWAWNLILTAFWAAVSVLDIFGYALGIRPQKKLRVCTVIFADSNGNPVAATPDVVNALNTAIEIYFREMNVVLIRSAPFQYSTGFLHPPSADSSWIKVRPMPDDQLTACCSPCMYGEELGLKGSGRKWEFMTDCFWGNWRRLLGVGAPVAIFVIRNMESGDSGGCGLGPLTDFIFIAASAPALNINNALQTSPDTTAHELGHICDLWHLVEANEVGNLMFANDNNLVDSNGNPLTRTGSNVFDWQAQLVRMSRHVSYF